MVEARLANPKPDVVLTLDYDTARALAALTGIGQIHYDKAGPHSVMAYMGQANGGQVSSRDYTKLLQPVGKAIKDALQGKG
jgi:hypothetical protein